MTKLQTTKILKTNNKMDLEQLEMSTVKLRHEDKSVKCRFFVVSVWHYLECQKSKCKAY